MPMRRTRLDQGNSKEINSDIFEDVLADLGMALEAFGAARCSWLASDSKRMSFRW